MTHVALDFHRCGVVLDLACLAAAFVRGGHALAKMLTIPATASPV
jgi:hypothetical protein